MTIRAYVETDFRADGVRCVIIRRTNDRVEVFSPDAEQPGRFVQNWRTLDDPDAVPSQSLGFTLPEDVALLLLDELLNHFRGGHDARQLRADYQAERQRVDKMLDALLVRERPA